MTHHPPSPPRGRARRDPSATRDRLVRAAIDLFTSVGYHGSTTPEIARRAGVAEGTIYRHFASKQVLLNEIYRAAVRRLAQSVDAAPPDRPCRDRLAAIAAAWHELAEADPALVRLTLQETRRSNLDPRSRDAVGRLRGAIEAVIAGGKATGHVRTGAVAVWTDVWLAVITLSLERVAARTWSRTPDAAQVSDAAWRAISTGG